VRKTYETIFFPMGMTTLSQPAIYRTQGVLLLSETGILRLRWAYFNTVVQSEARKPPDTIGLEPLTIGRTTHNRRETETSSQWPQCGSVHVGMRLVMLR